MFRCLSVGGRLSAACTRRFLLLVLLSSVASMLPASASEPSAKKPFTVAQQEQFKERDKLWNKSRQLRDAGNLDEAITATEKMLAIEQGLLGKEDDEVAVSLDYLAGLHEEKEDFTAARKLREEVLVIKTKHLGREHWQVTDARLATENTALLEKLDPSQRRQLAEADQLNNKVVALYGQGKFGEATDLARKTADIRRKILGEKHHDYATSLNNLALL
jgi:Tetratricopeptide repeat